MAIFAASIFFTSCEVDDPSNLIDTPETSEEDDSFKYSKDMEIVSRNGLTKAVISVSSDERYLLDAVNPADYTITSVFEDPSETSDEISDETSDVSEDSDAIEEQAMAFEMGNVELEEGAIGYLIGIKQTNTSRLSYPPSYWYSPKNEVLIKYIKGCYTYAIYDRSWNTSYSFRKAGYRCAKGATRHRSASHKKLKVRLKFKCDCNNTRTCDGEAQLFFKNT